MKDHFVDCCSILNVLAVGAYGEAEFWLSSGKVILIFILFGFTFFTSEFLASIDFCYKY